MATTENLTNLKIHKLSKAQYDRITGDGSADQNALYLTPGGYVTDGQQIDTPIGNCATAEGFSTNASGDYSHAEGH